MKPEFPKVPRIRALLLPHRCKVACLRFELEETIVMEKDQGSKPGPAGASDDLESSLFTPLLGGSSGVSGVVLPPKNPTPDEVDKKLLSNCHNKVPYQEDNDYSILFKAVVAVAIYFAVGIFACYFVVDDLLGVKTQGFIDSFYFCVVTLTTVGYGDLVPSTTAGKIFTSVYVFVGFGLVSALVGGAANYIVELQEKALMHAIRRKEQNDQMSEEAEVWNASMKVFVSGILLLSLFTIGVAFNVVIEGMTFMDGFYMVCVTITTLGYGDRSFTTAAGRFLGALWMLSSTVCLAQFFLYVAELRTESRQLKLSEWVLHRKTTKTDLQEADFDCDGKVSASDFVLYKLKEMGKLEEEDVADILKEFHELDCDNSGTLNVDDLRAQG